MKTQMYIKKATGTLFDGQQDAPLKAKREHTAKGITPAGMRSAACCALLLLLGMSGYMGASREQTKYTAAPVIQRTMLESDLSALSYEEIRARHDQDRQREIALLDSVIDHEQTQEEARNNALEQKVQIASRMEIEAQIRAALAHMGFDEAAVICGAQMITVILPEGDAQAQTVQIVDAAAGIAQVPAQDVKIILVKK